MKPFINKILISTLLIWTVSSCSEKDFLEIKPKSFLVPANVYDAPAGFESGLVSLRKALARTATSGRRHNILGEWSASEAAVPLLQLDWNALTPSFDRFYEFLQLLVDSYESIKNANVLIGRIDDINWPSVDQRNQVLAEAYWHRSFWYYWLVNAYGDVPFIGRELIEPKLDFQTHSRWAILDKIQTDMEVNISSLPDETIPGAITKAAGYHLLTKIYLANLNFNSAIAAATTVIDGPHSLMTQRFGSSGSDLNLNVIWDLHRPENKNLPENTETILALVDRFEAPPGASSSGLATMRHYNCAWYNSRVKDSEGVHGTIDAGPQYALLGRGNPDMPMNTYAAFEIWNNFGFTWQNTTDLRRADANWIDNHEILYNRESSIDFGKPIDPLFLPVPLDSMFILFPSIHYKVYVPQEDPNARPLGGNGDWYIYRLAETYLLRAEAYFWNDQYDLAAADLNTVRARANAVQITAGDVDLGFIFDERIRELYAESTRHAEMVRVSYILASMNRDGYNLENFSQKNWWFDRIITLNNFYTLKPSAVGATADVQPFHVLWPIKQSVITTNTLGVINQNIGYPGSGNSVPPLENITDDD